MEGRDEAYLAGRLLRHRWQSIHPETEESGSIRC